MSRSISDVNSAGPSSSRAALDADSTFKVLITTDNHLGFMERDPKRGDDSYTTFEEILRAARVEHKVDCIFLGGDLFHENKPSLGCLNRTCTLFRKYLWGSKPIEFSLRSKAADNFPTHGVPLANWQDPNMNIAVPAFAIHGNHDDPVGGTSSLDVLANNGHLNYFGLVASLEDIVVQPVLLQKGNTYVALYGLGNIRDDRLHRCFQLKKVHFIQPKQQVDANGVPIRWFCVLLLHQNRGMRDSRSKSGITEDMLAGFGLHLVIWGNEHEQRMVPEPTPYRFDIVQPGSSILTSITPLECNPKQYGILEIRGLSYRLTPFPLRSVRPVVRRTVELCRDHPRGRTLDEVEDFLKSVVEEMIDEAEGQLQGIPDDVLQFHPNIRFPLMRLSVDFTDPDSAAFPQPNFIRFGQQYMDVVANPGDMLKEIKASDKRSAAARALVLRRGALGKHAAALAGAGGAPGGHEDDAFNYASAIPQFRSVDIATKVAEVFSSGIRPPCQVLSEMELSAAVYAFAEKNERNAIEDKISEMLHTTQKMIWKRLGESDDILNPEVVTAEMRRCKIEREKKFFKELEEMTAGADTSSRDGAVDRDGRKAVRQPPGRGTAGTGAVAAGEKDEEEEATDNDNDDEEKQQAARFAHLSQMFDGIPPSGPHHGGDPGTGTAVRQTRGVLSADDGDGSGEGGGDAEELLRRHTAQVGPLAGDAMPTFLLDHMKILREQDEEKDRTKKPPASHQRTRVKPEKDADADGDGDDVNETGPVDYEALLGEELEELPADGLDRVTIEDFVAREIEGGGADGAAGAAGKKRTRGPGPVIAAAIEVDVDVDGDGGDDGVEVVPATGQPPRGALHVGQPTATKRRGERAGRGKPAPAPQAGVVVPALNLVPSKSGKGETAPRPAGGAGSHAAAGLQLLSKWGNSQH